MGGIISSHDVPSYVIDEFSGCKKLYGAKKDLISQLHSKFEKQQIETESNFGVFISHSDFYSCLRTLNDYNLPHTNALFNRWVTTYPTQDKIDYLLFLTGLILVSKENVLTKARRIMGMFSSHSALGTKLDDLKRIATYTATAGLILIDRPDYIHEVDFLVGRELPILVRSSKGIVSNAGFATWMVLNEQSLNLLTLKNTTDRSRWHKFYDDFCQIELGSEIINGDFESDRIQLLTKSPVTGRTRVSSLMLANTGSTGLRRFTKTELAESVQSMNKARLKRRASAMAALNEKEKLYFDIRVIECFIEQQDYPALSIAKCLKLYKNKKSARLLKENLDKIITSRHCPVANERRIRDKFMSDDSTVTKKISKYSKETGRRTRVFVQALGHNQFGVESYQFPCRKGKIPMDLPPRSYTSILDDFEKHLFDAVEIQSQYRDPALFTERQIKAIINSFAILSGGKNEMLRKTKFCNIEKNHLKSIEANLVRIFEKNPGNNKSITLKQYLDSAFRSANEEEFECAMAHAKAKPTSYIWAVRIMNELFSAFQSYLNVEKIPLSQYLALLIHCKEVRYLVIKMQRHKRLSYKQSVTFRDACRVILHNTKLASPINELFLWSNGTNPIFTDGQETHLKTLFDTQPYQWRYSDGSFLPFISANRIIWTLQWMRFDLKFDEKRLKNISYLFYANRGALYSFKEFLNICGWAWTDFSDKFNAKNINIKFNTPKIDIDKRKSSLYFDLSNESIFWQRMRCEPSAHQGWYALVALAIKTSELNPETVQFNDKLKLLEASKIVTKRASIPNNIKYRQSAATQSLPLLMKKLATSPLYRIQPSKPSKPSLSQNDHDERRYPIHAFADDDSHDGHYSLDMLF